MNSSIKKVKPTVGGFKFGARNDNSGNKKPMSDMID
jgi:hypothetical protein